jgi:formylglycine-generating enzyme required for sulfatase activity
MIKSSIWILLISFVLSACTRGGEGLNSSDPKRETTGIRQELLQGATPVSVMAQFTAGDVANSLTPVNTVVNFPRMFALDETEVTVDQYAGCVSASACTAPATDTDCNWQVSGRGSHPINCVSYLQAVAYCSWAGKRLPTRHEWEFAARFPDGRMYPWGNSTSNLDTKLNSSVSGDGYSTTSPVGSFPAGNSVLGLKDMAGNVYEMTQSARCSYETGPCTNCPTDETCDNPCDVCGYTDRTIKGGSYAHTLSEARAAGSTTTNISGPSPNTGFRCALTLR